MVKIISDYGYCFGVESAIKKLLSLKGKNGKVFLTHPLLHNRVENDELMSSVNAIFYKNQELSKDDHVVLSAHGHTIEEENFFKNKCDLIDATCPLILSRHKKIPAFNKETTYIYIGKRNHQETIGFLSHFPYFELVDCTLEISKQIENINFHTKSVVIPQTTISNSCLEEVKSYVSHKSEIVFSLPICQFYSKRCCEGVSTIKDLNPNNDAFIVCGDKSSSNANEIYNNIKQVQPTMTSFIALDINSLDLNLLKGKNIYIISATSVSKEKVENLKKDLEKNL